MENPTANKQFASLPLPSEPFIQWGEISRAVGTSVRAHGLSACIGQRCEILRAASSGDADRQIYADVVGVESGELILYPLGTLQGIGVGSKVRVVENADRIYFGKEMLGGVYDGFGQPMGASAEVSSLNFRALSADSPDPLKRQAIKEIFSTGIRSIDSMLTTGVGQRLGIFATAGGGKSTLLAMMARACSADVVVIALVGERGREVGEFLSLFEGMQDRVVMVVATSDKPAMERAMAAKTATAIAEGFREQNKRVLLLMDSVTRYARALREIGLSAGEPPVRRGFPPSVFSELPKLFERAGNSEAGSITAFYTVLVEGEDEVDPIAEECRSILDGHIVLSRALGESGHYPAIDILQSTSRLFNSLASQKHQKAASHVRRLMSRYQELELLLQMGEYQSGADPVTDESIQIQEDLRRFLTQAYTESVAAQESELALLALVGSTG